eukprot:gene14264-biopygen12624
MNKNKGNKPAEICGERELRPTKGVARLLEWQANSSKRGPLRSGGVGQAPAAAGTRGRRRCSLGETAEDASVTSKSIVRGASGTGRVRSIVSPCAGAGRAGRPAAGPRVRGRAGRRRGPAAQKGARGGRDGGGGGSGAVADRGGGGP